MNEKLDSLLQEYQRHDNEIGKTLGSPADIEDISLCNEFYGHETPKEIVGLYMWRNGQSMEYKTPFCFRDLKFMPLADVESAYRAIVETYGEDDFWGVEIKKCFPFAECEGAFLCLDPESGKIVQISEGVDIFFNSFELMIDTCIEWVSQKGYNPFDEIPNESEVWEKHNPGLEIYLSDEDAYVPEDYLGGGDYPKSISGKVSHALTSKFEKGVAVLALEEYPFAQIICDLSLDILDEDNVDSIISVSLDLKVDKFIEDDGVWDGRFYVQSGVVGV